MRGVRIGLGVSRDLVRGMAVAHDGHVLWQASTPRGSDEPIADVLARLWRDLPAVTRNARVIAVVGPAEGQLRLLAGLPRVRVAAELAALVRENAERFFVHESSRLRVSTPHSFMEGAVWAAAMSESLVDDVARACQVAGLRLEGIVPVAAGLARLVAAAPAGSDEASSMEVSWVDDGIRLTLELEDRRLVRVARMRASLEDRRGLESAIPGLEPPENGFTDASIATRLRATDPFVIGENTDDHRAARRSRIRTIAWSATAALLLVTASVAPGLIASRQTARARARLAALQSRERVLRRTEAALARATMDLDFVARFEASRRFTTVLLGELSYALPDSTAVTTLRIDSVGGTLTLVTPSAGATLEAMAVLPQLAHTQLTGSVTRELTAGVELEHATVRFSFPNGRGSAGHATARISDRARIASTPSAVSPPRDARREARPNEVAQVYGASPARGAQ